MYGKEGSTDTNPSTFHASMRPTLSAQSKFSCTTLPSTATMTTIAPSAIAGVMSTLTEPMHGYVSEVRDNSVLENAFPPRYEDIRRFVRFFDGRCVRPSSCAPADPYGVLGAMPRRGSESQFRSLGHIPGTDAGKVRFRCKRLPNLCRRTTSRRFCIPMTCVRLGCTCGSRCLRVRLSPKNNI